MRTDVTELVDKLERLWNSGELTECAYQIASFYGSHDYRLISDVMIEFKQRIDPESEAE